MPRTEQDFLADCDAEDSVLFQELFEKVQKLAAELEEDSNSRIKLWINFEQISGWSLVLQHPHVKGQASLLWGFPSLADADHLRGSLCTRFSDLNDSGIDQHMIALYGRQLGGSGFRPVGNQNPHNLRGGIRHVLRSEHKNNLVEVVGAFVVALDNQGENVPREPSESIRWTSAGARTNVEMASKATERSTSISATFAFPGVERNPGVRGGDPCIRQTRHGVAGLVQWRRLGLTDSEILERHPDLTHADLVTAWGFYERNREEVDQAISVDEEA